MAKNVRKPPQMWRAILTETVCLVVYATNQMDAWSKIDEYLYSINAPAIPRANVSLFVPVEPLIQGELELSD